MTNRISVIVLIVICIIFAILRFALPSNGLHSDDIFKDLAHVYVGGLFGAAIATKKRQLWLMGGGLTLIEIVAATIK